MRLHQTSNFDHLDLLVERYTDRQQTIGVFPGAFKPPHRGHFKTAASACAECDEVHIIMSPKERMLNQPSKTLNQPESAKYQGLMPGGNTNKQIMTKVKIETAEVDRLTSASAMRAEICDVSYGLNDLRTFEQCMNKYLPEQLTDRRKQQVVRRLYRARQDDKIEPREAQMVWRIYIDQLRELFKDTKIMLKVAKVSPIADTYALALELFEQTQETVTLRLYTGQ